jgi:hypothetical protein
MKKKAQIAIYFHTYVPFELEYSYRCYGCYWYAFMLEREEYQEEATKKPLKIVCLIGI